MKTLNKYIRRLSENPGKVIGICYNSIHRQLKKYKITICASVNAIGAL